MTLRSRKAHPKPRKAVTADIVGDVRPRERVPSKWKQHYRHLTELREFLLKRQDDQVRDANEEQPAFSLHMADAGTDSFDRDFALSRISSEQDALYEIDEALDRIKTGSYGICELTGKRIEPRRLEAIPWTRFSAEAEKILESNGEVRRARLSPREQVARASGETGGAAGEDEEAAEE